ncbi:MAG TPA: ABC transporter permease [Pyrinomonadaceae bacterium]
MLTKPGIDALGPNAASAPPDASPTPPALPRYEALPDAPLVTIEPGKSWSALDLRELWDYRELLYFLIWRDVKVRYKQTVLGAAWAVLQPLFMMALFSLLFGRVAGIDTGAVPYPLFAFVGLVPWTFFANAVTTSSNSLVSSTHLISKVYFPRLLVPAGAVAACLFDFALSFLALLGMLVYYRVSPTANLLMLPALVALMAGFALGVGMWLSSLNVKYRDVRFVLPFLIQLWLFASSVILPSSAVPERLRWLLYLNPMSGVVEGFRSALLGLPFDWRAIGVAATATAVVLVYAAYSFRRTERSFADII